MRRTAWARRFVVRASMLVAATGPACSGGDVGSYTYGAGGACPQGCSLGPSSACV